MAATPTGSSALRVLKVDREEVLMGDDVWDGAVLNQLAREFFEMVLRYVIRGEIDTIGLDECGKSTVVLLGEGGCVVSPHYLEGIPSSGC